MTSLRTVEMREAEEGRFSPSSGRKRTIVFFVPRLLKESNEDPHGFNTNIDI
jgi:hypothetical protein